MEPWLTFLIKECSDTLLPSITKLVNCSLMEGCVSDSFQTAMVTPVIKTATLPLDDLKNYHPVSSLSFISKLFERVVAKQILEYIHDHNSGNLYHSVYKIACTPKPGETVFNIMRYRSSETVQSSGHFQSSVSYIMLQIMFKYRK